MAEKKERLDLLLVEKGIITSREKAKACIMGGKVYVDGQKVDKAGEKVSYNANIEYRGEKLKYVNTNKCKDYDNFIQIANERVEAFNADSDNRHMRGEISRIQDMQRMTQQSRLTSVDMDAKGIGECDEETGSFASCDFLGMVDYLARRG